MRGILLTIAVLVSTAAAGTRDDAIPDARYREYGDTFKPYTARIIGVRTDGMPAIATCTLVAPHWALTAAHVVEAMEHCAIVTQDGSHASSKIVVHPEYESRLRHDIALVQVEEPFGLTRYPELTDGSEKIGSVCVAAGYGATGTLATGFGSGDGEIRAGTMMLDEIEGTIYICRIDRRSPLPFCIAPGDSGGGLFARDSQGRTVLVGVHSFVSTKGSPPMRSVLGEETGHTRVEPYLGWIGSVTGCKPHEAAR